MGTAGMKGLGSRHKQYGVNDLTVAEQQQRQLAEAQRQLARVAAENQALRGALAVVHRVANPYVPVAKATGESRTPRGLNELRLNGAWRAANKAK